MPWKEKNKDDNKAFVVFQFGIIRNLIKIFIELCQLCMYTNEALAKGYMVQLIHQYAYNKKLFFQINGMFK